MLPNNIGQKVNAITTTCCCCGLMMLFIISIILFSYEFFFATAIFILFSLRFLEKNNSNDKINEP